MCQRNGVVISIYVCTYVKEICISTFFVFPFTLEEIVIVANNKRRLVSEMRFDSVYETNRRRCALLVCVCVCVERVLCYRNDHVSSTIA